MGSRDRKFEFAFVGPALCLLVLFNVFPLVFNIVLSFTNAELIGSEHAFVGTANYARIFGDPRFAEAIDRSGNDGKRLFRLTPASLARARDYGMTVPQLETWFTQRTGQPMPAAARLLLGGAGVVPPKLVRHLVLQMESPELADGLMQWPGTRSLIAERLGPTALSISAENLEALRQRLSELGMTVQE